VVRRVETYDAVSRNRIVTRYCYHHGFYDGLEREFRGFGRVDQLDTEDFETFQAAGGAPAENWGAESNVPPVLTKTWFHTGVFLEGGRISRHLAHEYFAAPDAPVMLADTILPRGLTAFEARQACRALKGSMLRQEVYALDGTALAATPYSAAESNFTIVPLQPKADNRYAVFFTHPREAVTLHFERQAADPRIGHDLTLEVDDYGNVLRSATIGYQRRAPAYDEQGVTLATLTENVVTNAVRAPDAYRTPLPAETRSYQLTAPALRGAEPLPFALIEALAAFPHWAPAEGRTRPGFGAWAAHTPPIRRLAASVTHRIRPCVRGMRCCLPSPRPAAFPPPSPPPTLRSALFEASRVLRSRPTPHLSPDGFVSSTSRRDP
jgi:hypothetical protein